MNKIFKHFQHFIDFKAITIKSISLEKYYTVAKNLREFLQKNKEFQDLKAINSIRFMKRFNEFLYHTHGKAHIKRHLNTVRAFIVFLVNDEILPFSKVRDYTSFYPKEIKELISLSEEERNSIEFLELTGQKLERVKDLFLFQSYTGVSYSDLKKISKENTLLIDNLYYLKGKRSKTGTTYIVPLRDKALDILKKYNYALPVISNQNYNKYIKDLAKEAGVTKNLTSHIARKTCGQLFLNLGYSIEAVSKMLGHSDIKITQQHYARTSFELVHNENLKLSA